MDTRRLCELTSAADALDMKPLVDLASRALARLIEGKTPEQVHSPATATPAFAVLWLQPESAICDLQLRPPSHLVQPPAHTPASSMRSPCLGASPCDRLRGTWQCL